MKFLCVIIFFIGFCYCADEDAVEIPTNYWTGDVEDDYDSKGISRPCPNYDLECVRYYFAKNARCLPAYGKVPDPMYISRIALPLVNANLTLVLTKVQYKGLNGKVVEFYVNKLSDTVVLAVELRDVTSFSSEAFFRYQRKGKEPIVKSDFAIISYSSLTLTAVIPYANHLQLDKAEFSVFIDDPMPRYAVGPEASRSKDPVVQKSFTQLVTNINDNVREAFIVEAPLFMTLNIQNRICDFGLKYRY